MRLPLVVLLAAVACASGQTPEADAAPAPLQPADGRRGARAFRIPAPYRPLVRSRPSSMAGGPPTDVDDGSEAAAAADRRRDGTTAQQLVLEGCRQGERCEGAAAHTQELIEKFLRELAASNRDRPGEAGARPSDRDNKIDPGSRLQQLVVEADTGEPTNRLANLYLDEEKNTASAEESSSESTENDAQTEPVTEEGSSSVESQSSEHRWSLLESKSHHHPYDDREGWVTLEPVPWAAAKVAKWKPNPGRRPPWVTLHDRYGSQQSDPSPWPRPSQDYYGHHKPADDGYGYVVHPGAADIITDDRPLHHPAWADAPGAPAPPPPRPAYGFLDGPSRHHHHYQQHQHPASYPGAGEADGEWVLLSSTRGYSLPPHRRLHQRAVSFSARPLTARRSVQLTVLPAKNGTANTSTSHGGLLEVHSSFNSVEQDVRDRDKQSGGAPPQDVPVYTGKPPRPSVANVPVYAGVNTARANATSRPPTAALQQQVVRLVPGRRGANTHPGRAVLAAVGAGVLPATMAMLVPLALGRRRRRSVSGGTPPDTLWAFLPEASALQIKGESTSSSNEKNVFRRI